MFPVAIYEPVYLLIVTIVTFIVILEYGRLTISGFINNNHAMQGGALALCIMLVLFIGTRPHFGMGDTGNYTGYYEHALNETFIFTLDTQNVVFDNLLAYCASINLPITYFFIIISFLYFFVMLIACRKLFPEHSMLGFLVFLGAFSTFSYSTNGIKAGAAASVFILGLAYKDNKLLLLLCSFLSWGIHHSMFMVIVALVCTLLYKKTKTYFYIWAVCVLIAVAHITFFQTLFAGFSDEKGAGYLLATGDEDYDWITGFRLDFILYSAAPIAVGSWILFKKKIVNEGYEMWLRMYLLTNSVWMLCMYASYSNRIAYLSWFMYPIVLIYPFIGFYWNNKQLTYTKRTVSYHLLFTLFMVVVYYGFNS